MANCKVKRTYPNNATKNIKVEFEVVHPPKKHNAKVKANNKLN